jgi:predicted  nucleic acid-binding Zn-ribbon protein
MLEHELDSFQRRFGEQEGALAEQKKYRLALEQKAVALNNENEEMRKALRELSDANRRLSDYESRMALLAQEVERLNGNLRMKT